MHGRSQQNSRFLTLYKYFISSHINFKISRIINTLLNISFISLKPYYIIKYLIYIKLKSRDLLKSKINKIIIYIYLILEKLLIYYIIYSI